MGSEPVLNYAARIMGLRSGEEKEEKPKLLDDSTTSKAKKEISHISRTLGFAATLRTWSNHQ